MVFEKSMKLFNALKAYYMKEVEVSKLSVPTCTNNKAFNQILYLLENIVVLT